MTVSDAATPSSAFTLEHVSLVRDGRVIVDDICDHIHEGRATALVGPSGSGKTTLLRMLNRLEEPSSGCIKFHGTDVRTLDVRVLRRRVGLLGQRPIMLSPNVRSEVSFAAPQLSDDSVAELLRRVGLPGFALDRPTVDLSGGEQQRLALARALAVKPEVLLLDEPTSGLDGVAAAAVDSVIRALVADGLTVVLVSHDLTRAGAITDNARVLQDGRLVDRGDPTTVHYLRDE